MDYNVPSDIECDFPYALTNLNNEINKVSIQFSRLKIDSEKSKNNYLEKQKTKIQLSPFQRKSRCPLKRKSRSPSNEKSYKKLKSTPSISQINNNDNLHRTIQIKTDEKKGKMKQSNCIVKVTDDKNLCTKHNDSVDLKTVIIRFPLKRKSRSPINEKSYRTIKKLKPRQMSPIISRINSNDNLHRTIKIEDEKKGKMKQSNCIVKVTDDKNLCTQHSDSVDLRIEVKRLRALPLNMNQLDVLRKSEPLYHPTRLSQYAIEDVVDSSAHEVKRDKCLNKVGIRVQTKDQYNNSDNLECLTVGEKNVSNITNLNNEVNEISIKFNRLKLESDTEESEDDDSEKYVEKSDDGDILSIGDKDKDLYNLKKIQIDRSERYNKYDDRNTRPSTIGLDRYSGRHGYKKRVTIKANNNGGNEYRNSVDSKTDLIRDKLDSEFSNRNGPSRNNTRRQ